MSLFYDVYVLYSTFFCHILSLTGTTNHFFFLASRLVQPSSPGSAKRKVQQKLQRDAKQQIATPRSNNIGLLKLLNNLFGDSQEQSPAGVETLGYE